MELASYIYIYMCVCVCMCIKNTNKNKITYPADNIVMYTIFTLSLIETLILVNILCKTIQPYIESQQNFV
jgi:hypothetical protein